MNQEDLQKLRWQADMLLAYPDKMGEYSPYMPQTLLGRPLKEWGEVIKALLTEVERLQQNDADANTGRVVRELMACSSKTKLVIEKDGPIYAGGFFIRLERTYGRRGITGGGHDLDHAIRSIQKDLEFQRDWPRWDGTIF